MKPTTPMKAIRLRCLDCCAQSPYEVAHCVCENCALFKFRFGKRPSTRKKKIISKTPTILHNKPVKTLSVVRGEI